LSNIQIDKHPNNDNHGSGKAMFGKVSAQTKSSQFDLQKSKNLSIEDQTKIMATRKKQLWQCVNQIQMTKIIENLFENKVSKLVNNYLNTQSQELLMNYWKD
jgi:hypothetical protein